MREIKFRTWIKSVNAMSDWDTILKECDRFSLLHDPNFELMQFTGLKDKNDKEIFEGDVIKMWPTDEPDIVEVAIIDFVDGAFCATFDDEGTDSELLVDLKPLEIIGNIYENKELLK